ncbi:hypothetical protein P3T76_001710 [Phytophthora citrophthora]|uniref:Uncharacterized protein n=1 Tax=Phytophthora citrophthora TaxID=4793 RepID=A0AAD9H0F6_9STRA|nr:hypothetical protein P3T76_001710 [Phytophthora citrophthora]
MLRRHKRKRVESVAAGDSADDDEWSISANLIDDTVASIQLMMNRNSDSFAGLSLPPAVIWHQL